MLGTASNTSATLHMDGGRWDPSLRQLKHPTQYHCDITELGAVYPQKAMSQTELTLTVKPKFISADQGHVANTVMFEQDLRPIRS